MSFGCLNCQDLNKKESPEAEFDLRVQIEKEGDRFVPFGSLYCELYVA